MVPLGTASGPAVTRSNQLTDDKRRDCEAVVKQVFTLLESGIHTRKIMTREVSPESIPTKYRSGRFHIPWYHTFGDTIMMWSAVRVC